MTMYDPEDEQHVAYLDRHRATMSRVDLTATQISKLRAGFESCRVPERLREGLEAYALTGRPVGHFLTACLSNDLMGAITRGDEDSLAALPGIMRWLYNYAPPGCWRTAKAVAEWRERGGLSGGKRA